MRILGIDHGTRRIGLALSDPMEIIAQPLEYVPAEPAAAALERLCAIVKDQEVSRVVVGMPRNMDGSFGPAADQVREFVRVLREVMTVPVETWDERLTTAQAQRSLIQAGVRRRARKEKVDRLAAAILLQSYLDAHS